MRFINLIAGVVFLILSIFAGVCPAMTLTDDGQRRIIFDKPFQRIISLYGAHTENLYYLGLDERILGVSINDTYPSKVAEKQKFSYHDDPEKFLAFSPDLVLIRPMIDNGYPKLIQQLEKSGITVVSLQPSNVDEIFDYWRKLGLLTGKSESAEQMIREFKEKTDHIRSLTQDLHSKKKVYFEAIHTKMKTFTKGAMPIFVLETAGGINVASDALASRNTNIAVYGKEQLLSKALEIDVFLSQQGIMNSVSIETIKNEPGFNIIKAVKDNQIYLIDENIISRPVPRLYQGMVTVGRILYPDIFTEKNLNKEME
ncbi:MAG: peptide ABC transporter substrate-binding protein [Desulfobacula sp. RIFOXYA12_FULL_46_16]|nr:MAG: peptide ABC transporter substrate-binding protein [Desulfobacula sp. RIFOXYA12_FULL_46_16]